ncbi:acetyltransferase [Seminavis robusta]|uniref:Acetyltransferase n=1 Tax=Seminavis robusta TaxID=568900 RepID=A0A9N8EE19_9STRA|nr:acetyltransferase [Seminavis robusta]|eukprot:Sro954_g224300.1 acetyltransferase (249) ;mRNA; r:13317-14063
MRQHYMVLPTAKHLFQQTRCLWIKHHHKQPSQRLSLAAAVTMAHGSEIGSTSGTKKSKTVRSVSIREATLTDIPVLNQLALVSKAHWGYDTTFMDQCKEELAVEPDSIFDHNVFVANPTSCTSGTLSMHTVGQQEEQIAGFFTIERQQQQDESQSSPNNTACWELDALFVDPSFMGRGIGKALLTKALALVMSRGGQQLMVQSDPHAELFYQRMGGKRVGKVASSSISGRMLPLLVFDVAQDVPMGDS